MAVGIERSYCQNLFEVAAMLNSVRTVESMLHFIVENVASEVRATWCSAMLLTPGITYLFHTAAYGLSDSYIGKGSVSADISVSENPVNVFDGCK